jgi:hypothetical protein
MNYDTMSVHDLVLAIAKEGMLALQRGVTGDDGVSLVILESALRKAVIREASQEELFRAFSSFPCIETSKYYPDNPEETP